MKVFSMATSSPASERKFSTNGVMHSKPRNLLKEQNVKKLVFIMSNALQLGKDLLIIDWQDYEDDAVDLDASSFQSKYMMKKKLI